MSDPVPNGRAEAAAREALGSEAAHTGAGTGDASAAASSSVVASSPASFFSSSLSSTDSAFHRVAVLLCPGCAYLEFPGQSGRQQQANSVPCAQRLLWMCGRSHFCSCYVPLLLRLSRAQRVAV